MALPVGIDLGTTKSAISLYRRGKVETLRVDGKEIMPSAVSFRSEESIVVGANAYAMAVIRPSQTILSVKRKMGDAKFRYKVFGKEYTPVDISAMILKKLVEGREKELGGPAKQAVVTVPAYFTEEQRKDTRLAGEKAGLEVLRLLPEPTAAAIAYGLDKERDQTILVYDLGGGTFDVSILQIKKNNFEVKAVNGNHDLGGNDFDRAIRDYFLEKFKKESGVDLGKPNPSAEVLKALQVLTSASERVKKELTEMETSQVDLPNFFEGRHFQAVLDRKTFEGMISHYIFETRDLVMKTITDAKLDVDDIDRVVLVGGSTKIPLVQRIVADTIKEPYIADNVELAVSSGAAIVAASLYAGEEVRPGAPAEVDFAPVEITFTDVVAHSLSAEMVNEQKQLQCFHLIKKNMPMPTQGYTIGTTVVPFQRELLLRVYRGEGMRPEENQFIGQLEMSGITPQPTPVPLRVKFEVNRDGILTVEAGEVDRDSLRDMLTSPDPVPDLTRLRLVRVVNTRIKLPD